MKVKGLLVLALVLGTAPLVFAAHREKSITLSDATVVGNVTLQPGEYKLEWQGTGPNVQVTFSRGKKTTVTVPAKLEDKNSPYDGAVQLTPRPTGDKSLSEIDWKKMALIF